MRLSFGKKLVMKNGGKNQMIWITYILMTSGLILLTLQLSKYPSWHFFLYLVSSFSNKKKKLWLHTPSVHPQQHSIVCSLKSTWTVNYGHATIVFSVLHTMTSSSCLTASFCGKLKYATKCFYFLQCLLCAAEKIGNVIRGDVPSTYNGFCHGFSDKCSNPC